MKRVEGSSSAALMWLPIFHGTHMKNSRRGRQAIAYVKVVISSKGAELISGSRNVTGAQEKMSVADRDKRCLFIAMMHEVGRMNHHICGCWGLQNICYIKIKFLGTDWLTSFPIFRGLSTLRSAASNK